MTEKPEQKHISLAPSAPAFPPPASPGGDAPEPMQWPFDPWRIWTALKRWCPWLFLLALAFGIAAFVLLPKKTRYTAAITLLRRDGPAGIGGDRPAGPGRISPGSAATFSFINSAELRRRVSAKFDPPIPPGDLAGAYALVPQETAEIISIRIQGKQNAEATAKLANLFADEIALFSRETQAREAKEINRYLQGTLAIIDRQTAEVNGELTNFLREIQMFDYDKETDAFLQHRSQLDRDYFTTRIELESIPLQIENLKKEILGLRQGEIENLLVHFTEEHPLVQERRARLGALEHQLQTSTNSLSEPDGGSSLVNGLFLQIVNLRAKTITIQKQLEELGSLRDRVNEKLAGLSGRSTEYSKLRNRLQALQNSRSALANQQRDSQLAEENALGYYRPLTVLTARDVGVIPGWAHPALLALLATAALFGLGAAAVAVREVLDSRIKTPADVKRITQLPLLLAAPDLRKKSEAERAAWAFRSWTILTGKLGVPASDPVLCGFLSTHPEEGCEEWMILLAAAVHQRGHPVVMLSCRARGAEPPIRETPASSTANPKPTPIPHAADHLRPSRFSGEDWLEMAGRHLNQPNASLALFVPPQGWRWTWEHLQLWKTALHRFQSIPRAVILVELPPASEPEAALVAETLPRIIWIIASGATRAPEARLHLETLRHARCHLAGAALNRSPFPS